MINLIKYSKNIYSNSNVYKTLNSAFLRHFYLTSEVNQNSNKKQAKILGKFIKGRSTGTKRWYPDDNKDLETFKLGSLTKTNISNSKQNTRRINVLNKLFMENITDLMCTGSVSDLIVGKDIQITKTKISSDFSNLNVFWTSNDKNPELQNILDKCAKILRHELSQLRVVGEVPNINFVRDKTDENLKLITELLKNIDIKYEDGYTEDNKVKNETLDDLKMTHNIFGLDRQKIVESIRIKLNKSEEAWNIHNKKIE